MVLMPEAWPTHLCTSEQASAALMGYDWRAGSCRFPVPRDGGFIITGQPMKPVLIKGSDGLFWTQVNERKYILDNTEGESCPHLDVLSEGHTCSLLPFSWKHVCVCSCTCMLVHIHTCAAHVEVGSLLPLCRSGGSDSGRQPWQLASLLTSPPRSHHTHHLLSVHRSAPPSVTRRLYNSSLKKSSGCPGSQSAQQEGREGPGCRPGNPL